MSETRKTYLPLTFFSLFTSLSTLICCALPALLVTLGMGAALAGLVSSFPQLVWLSEHKILVFAVSGCMLLLSGLALYRSKDMPCPIDPELRDACLRGRKISAVVFGLTVVCYAIGAFFGFLAPFLFA